LGFPLEIAPNPVISYQYLTTIPKFLKAKLYKNENAKFKK